MDLNWWWISTCDEFRFVMDLILWWISACNVCHLTMDFNYWWISPNNMMSTYDGFQLMMYLFLLTMDFSLWWISTKGFSACGWFQLMLTLKKSNPIEAQSSIIGFQRHWSWFNQQQSEHFSLRPVPLWGRPNLVNWTPGNFQNVLRNARHWPVCMETSWLNTPLLYGAD